MIKTKINTNSKQFKKMVQNFIVNSFDNLNSLKQTFENCKHVSKNNYKIACYMVQGGCFDCYYSDIANTMASWFDCSVDDIWRLYNNDSQKLWDKYIHIVAINIVNIIEDKKCFLYR